MTVSKTNDKIYKKEFNMGDSIKQINCPACGAEMQKVFIADKGINIDICTQGCGGIYFDNKEIQEFSGESENIEEIKNTLSNKTFNPVDNTKTRICPICKIPMTKTFAIGIEIDTCYKCGGIFLDYGEFEQVRKNFKKREKVKPVSLSESDSIDIEKFLKEASQEEANGVFCRSVTNSLSSKVFLSVLDTLCQSFHKFY